MLLLREVAEDANSRTMEIIRIALEILSP